MFPQSTTQNVIVLQLCTFVYFLTLQLISKYHKGRDHADLLGFAFPYLSSGLAPKGVLQECWVNESNSCFFDPSRLCSHLSLSMLYLVITWLHRLDPNTPSNKNALAEFPQMPKGHLFKAQSKGHLLQEVFLDSQSHIAQFLCALLTKLSNWTSLVLGHLQLIVSQDKWAAASSEGWRLLQTGTRSHILLHPRVPWLY